MGPIGAAGPADSTSSLSISSLTCLNSALPLTFLVILTTFINLDLEMNPLIQEVPNRNLGVWFAATYHLQNPTDHAVIKKLAALVPPALVKYHALGLFIKLPWCDRLGLGLLIYT